MTSSTPMTDTQWYYQNLGEEFGPVSGAALRDLVDCHQLDGSDLVRESDSDQWKRADSIELPEADAVDEIPVDEDVLTSLDDIVLGEDTAPKKQRQQWYCQVLGQELGPMSFDDLLERAHSKQLTKSDPVRSDNGSEWVPAESIVGLFDHVKEEKLSAQTDMTTLSPQRPVVKKKKAKKAVTEPKPKPQKETEERIWFVKAGNNELGPFVFSEVQAMGQSGKLDYDDVVRFEGSGGWMSVNDISGIVPDRPTPKPPTAPPSPAAQPPAAHAINPPQSSEPKKSPSPPPAAPKEPSPPQPPATSSPAAASSTYAGPGGNSSGMGGYGSSTSSYGGGAPAASRPAAPSRPAYKPAKKSSSSGGGMSFDLSGMFSNLSFNPKVIGAVSVVLLLVLGGVFVLPNLAGFGDSKYYDQTKEIYDRMAEVGPGNLDTLKGELTPKIEATLKEIQPIASSRRELLRTLIDCYKFYFPKAMEGDEEQQKMFLERARRSLEKAETFL